ncbi:hypothetical protein GCM10009616_26010 [Microlunatus lacustris]
MATVDMAGDHVDHHLAGRFRQLEEAPLLEEAVLTRATPEEPGLRPWQGCRTDNRGIDQLQERSASSAAPGSLARTEQSTRRQPKSGGRVGRRDPATGKAGATDCRHGRPLPEARPSNTLAATKPSA